MSAMPPPPPPPPAAPGHPDHFAHAQVRAGFGARLGGYLLDGLLYGLVAGVFVGAGVGMIVAGARDCIDKIDAAGSSDTVTCTNGDLNSPGLVFGGIVVIALGALIVLFMYCRALGKTGQTWGRKIIGVRVVDKFTEQPIGFGRALGRTLFAHIISSAFCSIGYLWMLWDGEQQTWHDKVIGSVVVSA